MTLVEVIGALALLGVVVGMLLVARGKLMTKGVEAERRSAAVRALDGLISEWWAKPDAIPLRATGERDGWNWRTEAVANPSLTALGGNAVRVEVSDARGVAATVEVAVPVPSQKGGKRAKAAVAAK